MQSGKLRKCKRRNKKHPVKGEIGWVTFANFYSESFIKRVHDSLIIPSEQPSGILTAKTIREAVAKMKAITI